MSRHASQSTKSVPMPKTAVHPLEIVRCGLFNWWSVAAMSLFIVVSTAVAAVALAL